ncbi:hypothetical protein BH09PSE3_BH09PSE3_04370 [soil metagenome]
MNALIPAFVAVLLAEIGGSLVIFGRERRIVAAVVMVLLVAIAAIGGWSITAMLITPARTLLLGLALLFAGWAQFGQPAKIIGKPTIITSALTLYRSPAPFLAFAFASLMNAPLSAAAGTIAGVGVAAAPGVLDIAIPRTVRAGAGVILCLAGIFAALSGLRLI